MIKIDANDVANGFKEFMELQKRFRKDNNLNASIDNIYEVLTAMADKHGRICREIKHFERNDPKPDWPDGLSEAVTGYINYMIMVLEKYEIDIAKGMENELQSAVDQYGDK